MQWDEIKTREDFATFIGVPYKYLTYLLYNQRIENLYIAFEIPKKSGGVRIINSPEDRLKKILKKIMRKLEERMVFLEQEGKISSKVAHGFIKSKNIITNASSHHNRKIVLNVDIENFFPSFHFGRVKGFFEKNKYFKVPKEVAVFIAQLTCYNGSLPQGSPCSPIITNLICQILDFRIIELAQKYNLKYTRYADDMTFSTNDMQFVDTYIRFVEELGDLLTRSGFSLNDEKTHIQFQREKQTVTGLTVNKKVNVSRHFYKNTRAMVNTLYKKGEFMIDGERGTINQLFGRFNFIDQLVKYNNRIEREAIIRNDYVNQQKNLIKSVPDAENKFDYLKKLSAREREYRKFLYYYYFFSSTVPVIVTEGKTDSRYIKAALKNLYRRYPKLIERDEKGKFVFKIKFLRRTALLKYYFRFFEDGADAMKNLSNCWFGKTDEKLFPNYSELFKEITNRKALKPVIFLFDNELKNNKKPIRNFINHVSNNTIHDNKTIENEIRENNIFNVIDNLYLLTHPSETEDEEIEDLFDDPTLDYRIAGKVFTKESKFDVDKYYGKNDFSNYILQNYSQINFKNFTPLLDNLNKIVDVYEAKYKS
ncbi:TPA: retron Ec67 family RNA-directed DNA polymerase/endonuclease [Streptococcus suis]